MTFAQSLRRAVISVIAIGSLSAFAAPPRAHNTVPVVFLSDIHFNPFNDPATVAKLIKAPLSQWNALLAAEPRNPTLSPAQQGCASQPDTQYALFHSSLRAMKVQASSARFVTVSGDLLGHNFLGCFEAFVLPQDRPDGFSYRQPTPLTEDQQHQYSDFVNKTLRYLTTELALTFPDRPIYFALGNNDSDCDDYELTPHSDFLRRTAVLITARLPQAQRHDISLSFSNGGNYEVPLTALPNTRLLVLDDIFLSESYTSCASPAGPGDPASAQRPDPAAAEVAWLKAQLDTAQAEGRKVWVMGHVPPSLDLYSSVKAGHPVPFLKPEYDLASVLSAHPDTVRLAIFAHTHIDGMSQLKTPNSDRPIPLKSVQSISPDHGNPPSFTLAKIDPDTSDMVEYTVIGAVKSPTKTSPVTYTWPAPRPPNSSPTWSSTAPTSH